ncbi:hypothetical protein V6N13_101423 [Hibiscus sabdariffa]|uniref:Uncharacterized protein n=1 Tax=Hibiscus sabdariffa TaxID=183260 RepID=A0ABR2QLS1_9ROSI
MLHLLLHKCFDKLLEQDDKGDVSNRDNGSCPGRYLGWYSDLGSVLLCYWHIPKSCNCLSCLYTIFLSRKAVTSSLPLSQEYFPHKANYCCIFLAAETLLLPIPRRS